MASPFVSELGPNGNGHSASQSVRKPIEATSKGGVAVVDVEQRRYDNVETILDRLVGKDESFALAKMSRFRRQSVSNYLALVRLFQGQGEDLEDMNVWGLDQIKGDLDPQKPYERAIDNLTKQGGEKPGFLEKWFGREK